jgi:hypothetical protein
MSKLRVNTVVNRTNTDKVIFPYGIGVTNGIILSGIITATGFVGNGVSLTNVRGEITFQDPGGNNTLTGISTVRVGTGMTLTQVSAGIASIRPTGYLENLNVVGLSTFGTSGLTTINSSGQIKSQVNGNIIRQTVSLNSNLTSQLAADYPGAFVKSLQDGQAYLASTTGGGSWAMYARANHIGIITASGGFVATGSSVGFTGPLNSTGISTVAFLQSTTINVSAAATVGTSLTVTQDVKIGRHLLVSGISTVTDVNATGGFIGNLNSSGVSSITQLVSSTVNASGIITATGGFVGNITGNVTGNLNGNIASSGISTLGRIDVSSINAASGISTIQQLKGDTISITGVATASQFSGNATGLTGTPNILVGFVTSNTILPSSDAGFDLGSPSARWNNIYSADMHFSNEGRSNSVDGTWGNWTLQEGEDNIFMINNRTGKKYKINLTEI